MTEFALEDVPDERVATIRRVVAVSELPAFFKDTYAEVAEMVPRMGGRISGPPFALYHGMPSDTVDVTAGFPVVGDVRTPAGEVALEERRGGQAAVGIHVGPYETLGQTYEQMQQWIAAQSLRSRGDMWEEYLTPAVGDPATWQTRIVMRVATGDVD